MKRQQTKALPRSMFGKARSFTFIPINSRMKSTRCIVYGFFIGMAITVIFINFKKPNLNSFFDPVYTRKRDSVTKVDRPKENLEPFRCDLPPFTSVKQFFNYGRSAKTYCKEMKAFGGESNGDGAKMVCLDREFRLKPGNCVVLSFGINNEWSFDDEMDQNGCTVYAFDPTMGVSAFDRSKNIHFYDIGISNFKGKKRISKQECNVDRYENILEMLGLTNTVIDYLKMDIEHSEIEFFQDIFETNPAILKNVKQIGMEIHPLHPSNQSMGDGFKQSNFYKLWAGMKNLECLGFKLLHYEMNKIPINHYVFENRWEACCYEVVWIRYPEG